MPTSLEQAGIRELSEAMDGLDRHVLKFTPWKEFDYMPGVSFSICYSPTHIFVKYFVEEKEIRANVCEAQGAVWEDSCVEFFVSFDNDEGAYYNFEFNCLGSCFASFGSSKLERVLLSHELVKNIITHTSIVRNEENDIHWELAVAIPISSFQYSSIKSLQGTNCRANFYKCGDLLSEPHFVAWSDIKSGSPNFHLPSFFGKIDFN